MKLFKLFILYNSQGIRLELAIFFNFQDSFMTTELPA